MDKKARQKIIKDLIEKNQIKKQSQLVEELAQLGYKVTQATVSRDLKELNLYKSPDVNQRNYSITAQEEIQKNNIKAKIINNLVKVDNFEKNVFLEVTPGSGPNIASMIDDVRLPSIFATMSDDDKVMIFMTSNKAAKDLAEDLKS